MKKETFVFNVRWRDAIRDCSAEVRLEVYEAIIEYVSSGILPEMKPLSKLAFSFIKMDIDKSIEKFKETCEKRRQAAEKRWGKMQMDANASKCMQTYANDAEYEYENDNNIYSVDDDIRKKLPSNEGIKKRENSPPEYSDDYKKFLEWMPANAQYIHRNIKPLTEAEFMKLKAKYTGKEIADTILQIENRKDLRKRYTSLYRTLLNWLKNNYGERK